MTTDSTETAPKLLSARRWELANGQGVVDWLHASGVAMRMLEDVCAAVDTTVSWTVRDNPDAARHVIEQFPNVLSNCDSLPFDTVEQALAYLVLHLPDRYCRMFQVLERLLVGGALPLGKSPNFAVMDIGAGPGPGIFAIRSFYAAMVHYVSFTDPAWPVIPLGHTHVVERSSGMPWIMHRFAEALIMAEQGRANAPDADNPLEANPCAAQLERSSTPFGAHYEDFAALDVRREYEDYRRRQDRDPFDDDLFLNYFEPYRPGGYALAVMMNFLTTTDAVPRFSEAIERLMRRSLVPGGTILILGGVGGDYLDIYPELDRLASASRLNVLNGFDEPLQAGHREQELAALSNLTRETWNRLEALAGDVGQTKQQLRDLKAADIFDDTVAFRLPRFRVRVYRRGR